MKKKDWLKMIKGHESKKYGQVFTEDQRKINELIKEVNNLKREIESLKTIIFS